MDSFDFWWEVVAVGLIAAGAVTSACVAVLFVVDCVEWVVSRWRS